MTGAEMVKDRERIERCLAVVEVYEASGLKAGAWAAANGLSITDLSSWCAHAGRWRVQLGLQAPDRSAATRATACAAAGFARAVLPAPASAATSIRVEWPSASGALVLHWPIGQARELGAWLREVAR